MRRAKIVTMLGAISLSTIAAVPPQAFEFETSGRCSSRMSWANDKLTVKRGINGILRAQITSRSSCTDEKYVPRVDYLEGEVRIRVERKDLLEEVTSGCMCTNKLTFKLNRPIVRGTAVVFGFGSNEPHLRAVAP
jgi:hypothetical protein